MIVIRILLSPFAFIIGCMLPIIISPFLFVFLVAGIGYLLINEKEDAKEAFKMLGCGLLFSFAFTWGWITGKMII